MLRLQSLSPWLIPWLILATLSTNICKASDRLPNGGACYSKDEIDGLAETIQDLQACRLENTLRKQFIDEKMTDFASASSPKWWQSPTVVVGGVVVGFSVGVAVGILAMRGH